MLFGQIVSLPAVFIFVIVAEHQEQIPRWHSRDRSQWIPVVEVAVTGLWSTLIGIKSSITQDEKFRRRGKEGEEQTDKQTERKKQE